MDYPATPLRRGSTDTAAVSAVQRQLNRLAAAGDPQLAVDGIFGLRTVARVKQMQSRSADPDGRPLDVDGVVGPDTWAALFGDRAIPAPAVTDPFLSAVIALARTQTGVLERPLGSNRGPEVDHYIRAAGLDPERGSYAWCAAFLCWLFAETARDRGIPNPLPRTAGVQGMWRALGTRGRYRLTAKQAQAAPQLVRPGMLFFLGFGRGLGHTGLVVGVRGQALVTIEGNTNGGGSREGIGVFERNRRRISQINLGFADPIRAAA
ncbi:MAG: peptidoglycan-binding protein [Sphingomonadaceae bacterium]